ncbi:MAG: hypothetical protein ACM3Y9_13620 [Ignavibacteria bacterium]
MLRPTTARSFLFSMLTAIAAAVTCTTAAAAEGAAPAAPPAAPANERMAPAEVVKPVIPNKAEMAESAFKKLDATGKGYVTLQDTSGLEGFEPAFREADTDHTGKLDLPRFKKAWAQYSGYKE